jgi:hypothetical protein
MTTTVYDTHFMASDIAFTDEKGNVQLDIPFGKIKRLGSIVIGMAGCLSYMKDFTEMLLAFVQKKIDKIEIPTSITTATDRNFVVMIYLNGKCLKIEKPINGKVTIENITEIPTVIGSGSKYVKTVLDDCPNAVVAVLEAIKRDKYTAGGVKYCSIRRDDIHNLDVNPMSAELKTQITGFQHEIEVTNDFLSSPKNEGKSFHASTEVYCLGKPSPIAIDEGLFLLEQGFSEIRNQL